MDCGFQYVKNNCSTVYVYDSLFEALNKESTNLILKIFQNHNGSDKNAFTIVMKKLQKQEESVDCGLFTIAAMASLAHQEDPNIVTYNQKKLTKHLIDCFYSIMPHFPNYTHIRSY